MTEDTVVTVKRADLEEAFEFVSMGQHGEFRGWISFATGKVSTRSYYDDGLSDEEGDEDEEEDEDEGGVIHIPHKNELGLGVRLVMRFAREVMPGSYDAISEIFDRRGGYRRFKNFLIDRNMTQRWYDFERAAMKEALEDWCKGEGIVLVDELPGAGSQ